MKKRLFIISLVLVMLLASLVVVPVSATETPEILGASIRTEGTQGLRFVGRIKASDYSLTYGETANFGIILLPANKVNAGTEISADTGTKVKAKILMSQATVEAVGLTYESGYVYFSAVMTNIPKENYGTELLARVYIDKGNGSYTYSAQTKRSVIYVANAVVAAGGEVPSAITTVVSDYNSVGSDILVDGSTFGLMADPVIINKFYV